MEINNRLENKLGFEQIREMIKSKCLSSGGLDFVQRMQFSNSFDKIKNRIELTEEFRQILLSNSNFPSNNYFDMRLELERLRLEGTFISQNNLFDLKYSLHTIDECLYFFTSTEEKYSCLKKICNEIYIDKELIKYCGRLIDEKGEFFDNASENLYSIRQSIRRKVCEMDKRMQKVLSYTKKEGWSGEDAEITVRNGRLVIPIVSSNKRKIKGFIHDESATGQTSYIEPVEIVELNNEVKELELEQKREIIKILTEFTIYIRPFIDKLMHAYYFLAQIDFIRAKAQFALQIGAGKPIIQESPKIYWFEARHPLLELSLCKNGKSIVPLKIDINEKDRILIISGPNAGGKSVCLKTVGLLQYMLQCGLLVPMRETSEVGIFDRVFIDIGDEQSLENDLSTYSSHLFNMKNLCQRINSKTLFLIDECGTGTEPSIGGAIAEAIIEYLNNKKAFGVVTTHYSNLKLLADREQNIVNGAMLFDQNNMRPLYKLIIGKPGSSFAFEIAQTIGLPKQIIDSATRKIGNTHFDFEQQLQALELEKIELKKNYDQIRVADDLLSEVLTKYNRLNEEIESQRGIIIKQAKLEAKQIIKNANRYIEQTISEIKSIKAEKQRTIEVREELKKELEKIDNEIIIINNKDKHNNLNIEHKNIGIKLDSSLLQIGDIVKIGEENTFAEVIRIKKDKIEVISNSICIKLPLNQVIKVDKVSYLKQQNNKNNAHKEFAFYSIMDDLNDKRAVFKHQIDLRGLRAEEALEKVARFIDEARLLGERELSVLHGKGDGILKTIIRDYLRTNSEVESFKSAHVELGGEGITQLKLR